jgi:glycosyltransferase involved in cell wall biosynthesis
MKIGIVNSFFPPWRGGAETYAYNLARALSGMGHEVTVLCSSLPLRPGISKEGRVTVRRRRLIGRIYGTPIMPSLVGDLLDLDVDVFHANFPSPYIALTVATASRIRRIPAVLTWHNDLPPVTSLANVLIRTHDTVILPRYIRAYRRVIATSEIYAKQSQILPTLGRLVTVIPNGVDCKRFHPEVTPTTIRAQLRLEDKFAILFVGALTKWHRYKGLDVLLSAMKIAVAKRKDLRLLIVGDGELRKEYRIIAAELGITANILFLGDVSDNELPEYYAASDVTALPSKDMSEGFGLTILEANASGKPVVASNVGGIPGVVNHGYNGLLLPPNDASTLAEAILYLSKNRGAAAAMGRNGRKVAEQHDWKRTAALTEQVYVDALAA